MTLAPICIERRPALEPVTIAWFQFERGVGYVKNRGRLLGEVRNRGRLEHYRVRLLDGVITATRIDVPTGLTLADVEEIE